MSRFNLAIDDYEEEEGDTPDFETDRIEVANWAAALLAKPREWCILDTETTGLTFRDEVVQIAVLAGDGAVLFDSLVKPVIRISSAAIELHGIDADKVANAPSFAQIWPQLQAAIGNRKLAVYNRVFDAGKLYQSAKAINQELRDEVYEWLRPRWEQCAMEQYAQFCGEWSSWHGKYKWQKLPGGDHSALGDCRAVLEVIKLMAASVVRPGEECIVPGCTHRAAAGNDICVGHKEAAARQLLLAVKEGRLKELRDDEL